MTNSYAKYHQRTYAEKILREGFQSSYYNMELKYLARLMKEEGCKPKEIRDKLIAFVREHCPGEVMRNWYVRIDKAIAAAKKDENMLIECGMIDMYLSEVEYIDSLGVSENAKRTIFAMMVHKKLDKQSYELRQRGEYKIFTYGNNDRLRSLPRVAKLNGVKNLALEVLHELREAGLIDVIECKGSPFKLNFADKIVFEGKIAVRIADYDSIGLYWEWLHGKKDVGVCCQCWGVYTTKSKKRCFCDAHQGYQKKGDKDRTVQCIDCGAEFTVGAKNARTIRCEACQEEENRRKKKAWKEEHGDGEITV